MTEQGDIAWETVTVKGIIAARPRPVPLEAIALDLPDGLEERLTERIHRLGYLNGYIAVSLHHPGAILALLEMTEHLKAALDPAHVLVVALATHHVLGNEYERVQYLDIARESGMAESWIAAAQGLTTAGLTAAEEAVRRLTLAVVLGEPPAPVLAVAGEHFDDPGLVAIIQLAGRFLATSRISQALSLQPMTSG